MAEQKIENPFKDGPEFDGTDANEQGHILAYSLEQAWLAGGADAENRPFQGHSTGNESAGVSGEDAAVVAAKMLRDAGYTVARTGADLNVAVSLDVLRTERGFMDIAEDDERLTQ